MMSPEEPWIFTELLRRDLRIQVRQGSEARSLSYWIPAVGLPFIVVVLFGLSWFALRWTVLLYVGAVAFVVAVAVGRFLGRRGPSVAGESWVSLFDLWLAARLRRNPLVWRLNRPGVSDAPSGVFETAPTFAWLKTEAWLEESY